MSAKIFLSTVSDEFRAYRDQLRGDLTRHNVEVKVQEDFKDLGGDTLDKLDVYIAHCDAVVHLAGDMTGSDPGEHALSALRSKYPDLADKLPPLDEALRNVVAKAFSLSARPSRVSACRRADLTPSQPYAATTAGADGDAAGQRGAAA